MPPVSPDTTIQLSQSLSSFSLSRTTNAFGIFPSDASGSADRIDYDLTPPAFQRHFPIQAESPAASPKPYPGFTPRRSPGFYSRTSFMAGLPRDHPHPSTAPLPQISSFLGSPFSSKTARGGYTFHAMSPSKGARTERIGQHGFEDHHMDWMERSEWIVDDQLQHFSDEVEDRRMDGVVPATKLRRDPSSTSSMNDSCESGTSSSSLISLGRSSGEQARPNIWGEVGSCLTQEEDDEDQATPNRRLFPLSSVSAVDTHLEMSIKAKQSPSTSPLVAKSRAGHRSPLQVFFMHSPAAALPSPPSPPPTLPSPARTSKTSFNSLLPRLISARKTKKQDGRSQSGFTSPSNPLITSAGGDGNVPRGGETASAPSSRLPMSKSRRNLFHGLVSAAAPSTDGRQDRPLVSFDRSIDSQSSQDSETELSPSRSARRPQLCTSVTSSTSASTETTASSTDSPIEPARAALLSRRKTVASRPVQSVDSTTDRPSRPSRPSLRRGITDPKMEQKKRMAADLLSPDKLVSTPVSVLFGDEKPSPAAFASTGLVKKRSMTPGSEIPRFGDGEPINKIAGLPRSSQPVKSRLGMMVAQRPAINRPPHALSIVVNNNSDDSSPMTSSGDIASARSNATGPSTDASVSVYTRAVPTTRGLRRKTSSMFGPSASVTSIGDGESAGSPATPTKPGMCESEWR